MLSSRLKARNLMHAILQRSLICGWEWASDDSPDDVFWRGHRSDHQMKILTTVCESSVRLSSVQYETSKRSELGSPSWISWDPLNQRQCMKDMPYILQRKVAFLINWQISRGSPKFINLYSCSSESHQKWVVRHKNEVWFGGGGSHPD